MNTLVKRFYLINKRLLKKASFIIILCAVPALVLAFSIISREDSGIVNIILVQENKNDTLSSDIADTLLESGGLISIAEWDDLTAAVEAVRSAEADAVWILPDRLQEKIDRYSDDMTINAGFIEIIEREETIPLQLAREKLYGAVYPNISYAVYNDYIRTQITELDRLSDMELKGFYDGIRASDNIFDFEYTEQNEISGTVSYLIAPLRGMLSVLIMLCAFAASMYYTSDKSKGIYVWLGRRGETAVEFGYAFAAAADIAVITLISNCISGVAVSLPREIGITALYCIAAALFSVLLRRMLRNISVMGAMLPFITIGMILICPVFINIESFGTIRLLLPPYYYLNAVYNDRYIIYMALYIIILVAINTIVFVIGNKQRG